MANSALPFDDIDLSDFEVTKVVNASRQSSDMFALLADYLKYITTLNLVNEGNAPVYLSKINEGFLKIIDFYLDAQNEYLRSKRTRKAVEARIAVDDFAVHCKENDVKGTEKLREYFVQNHPDYLSAQEDEDKLYAKLVYLDSVKTLFDRSIGSIRSIVYGRTLLSSISGNHA